MPVELTQEQALEVLRAAKAVLAAAAKRPLGTTGAGQPIRDDELAGVGALLARIAVVGEDADALVVALR